MPFKSKEFLRTLKYLSVYAVFAVGFLTLVYFLLNDNSPVSDEIFYRNFFGAFSYDEMKAKFLAYGEGRNPPLYPYLLNIIFNFVDYNIFNHRLISAVCLFILNVVILRYLYPNLLNSLIALLIFNTSPLIQYFFVGRVYALTMLLATILVLGKRPYTYAASFLGSWTHYTFPVFGVTYFFRRFILKKTILQRADIFFCVFGIVSSSLVGANFSKIHQQKL